MIQRKQTLFLLQAIFCNVALLFIPFQTLGLKDQAVSLSLWPSGAANGLISAGYFGAVALNFISLILATVIIFLYQKRHLQVRLSYLLMVIWMMMAACMLLCPMTNDTAVIESKSINYFFLAISAFALLAGWLAVRHIKKDIELLKSADRIR